MNLVSVPVGSCLGHHIRTLCFVQTGSDRGWEATDRVAWHIRWPGRLTVHDSRDQTQDAPAHGGRAEISLEGQDYAEMANSSRRNQG